MGIEGILVRGDEARITFRDSAAPRVKGLSAAFHDVQFQAEVRRAVPLSLKLTRLGGAPMLDGLVRALRGLVRLTLASRLTTSSTRLFPLRFSFQCALVLSSASSPAARCWRRATD